MAVEFVDAVASGVAAAWDAPCPLVGVRWLGQELMAVCCNQVLSHHV